MFENRIEEIMFSKGLLRKQLCELTGINKGSLSKIIAGSDVKLSTMKNIADVLGCSISEIWE